LHEFVRRIEEPMNPWLVGRLVTERQRDLKGPVGTPRQIRHRRAVARPVGLWLTRVGHRLAGPDEPRDLPALRAMSRKPSL
jgi:hypothetical protein